MPEGAWPQAPPGTLVTGWMTGVVYQVTNDWVFIVNPVWQGLLEVVSSESYFSPACLRQGVIEQGQIGRRPARIAQVPQE